MPERRIAVGDLGVGDRELQPVAEHLELVGGELLDLVGGVARLDAGAERPSLDRLRQDDRRAAFVLHRHLVGRVELPVVVPAAWEHAEVVVGEVLDEALEAWVGAEEVLADVAARLDRVLLELPVDGGVHLVDQHAVHVAREKVVPAPTPDDLDHVPARAPERGLELLDDLAIAADGAVEALQVAVDDEDQVVELLARGEREPGHRLGLVHLAVADERPHLRPAGVGDLAAP